MALQDACHKSWSVSYHLWLGLIIKMMMMMTGIIMIIITKIIVVVIVIIMTSKGAFRDVLQSPDCVENCLQPVRLGGHCAVMCKSRATYWALMTCGMLCGEW